MMVINVVIGFLDNATQAALVKAIEDLSRELTIIIIFQRLSRVQRCDRILELQAGYPVRIATGSLAAGL